MDQWITLRAERVLFVDEGRDTILCDRGYQGPIMLLVKLTVVQKDAVSWAHQTGALVRWSDGLWRGLGAQRGDDEFEHDDVLALTAAGVLEMTPLGAIVAHGQQSPTSPAA